MGSPPSPGAGRSLNGSAKRLEAVTDAEKTRVIRSSRNRPQNPHSDLSIRGNLGQRRDNISDIGEASCHSKSPKGQHDHVDASEVVVSCIVSQNGGNWRSKNNPASLIHSRTLAAKTSKEAEDSRLFDKSTTSEARNSPVPTSVLMMFGPIVSCNVKRAGPSPGILSASRLPLPTPKRISNIILDSHPQDIVHSAPTIDDRHPTCVAKAQYASFAKVEQRPKNNLIGDKIRLFEKIGQQNDRVKPEKQEHILSGMLDHSIMGLRKGLFKSSALTQLQMPRNELNLNSEEFQCIIDEVQDRAFDVKNVQGKMIVSSRNAILQKQARTVTNENEISGSSSFHESEIVVKKAQCALRQPKPLNIFETRRMRLLCRSKEKPAETCNL